VTLRFLVDLGLITCDEPWHLIELLEFMINLLIKELLMGD
jgi:hypothetical protein